MNSQSWFDTAVPEETGQRGVLRQWWDRAAWWRYPVLLVVLPTLLVAAYFYLIAADQYESTADFIVSSTSSQSGAASGVGSLLSISTGSSSQSASMAVPDYLESHQAVADLGQSIDLAQMFRRPEADVLSRLGRASTSPEALLQYYKGMVKIHLNQDTSITSLTVHAFRPEDAYSIATHLLQLSEQQVNRMNRRRYDDAVGVASAQVVAAQQRVADIQARMTGYRQSGQDVDPQVTGETQIKLVSGLQAQLATAQASLAAMRATISPSSPQVLALQREVSALQGQIAGQSAQLTGNGRNIATKLGGYEDLRVQQEFAAKNYEAAAASLTKAQEDAGRQQLYLVRVVDANKPVKSLYPQRARIVLLTFIALCVAYGIGWLILAGVHEHAA